MWLVFGNSMLHALSQHISGLEPLDGVSELVNMLETLFAGVFALGLCYTFLPAGKRRFVSQLPGAACATVGCGILTFGYRIYVDNFANSTMLYGSMAAVALLLFWMYLVFCILIAAGFLNRYLQERRVVV
jgi:membrane protein